MTKRRTRSQKIKAQKKISKYTFDPGIVAKKTVSKPSVKGYFDKADLEPKKGSASSGNAVPTDELLNSKLVKKELLKSIIIASFVLCLIVMIYLLWYR